MKKILLVMPRTPREDFAGIENSVLNVAKVASKKYAVEVITTARHPQKNVEFEGVSIREFPGFSPSNAYFFSPGLASYIKHSDADLVHANGYNNLATLSAMMNVPSSAKLVVTLNSSGSSSLLRKVLRVPYHWIFSTFASRVDAWIAVSRFEQKTFRASLPVHAERVRFIPNGVDDAFFNAGKSWSSRADRILFVGRLVQNKGADYLLRAFSLVHRAHPEWVLSIVGKGSEEKSLRALARELGVHPYTHFLGEIPRSRRGDLISLMGDSKVFVLPSRYESQGIVVSEAIASGMIPLVEENSALYEFVTDGCALGVERRENIRRLAEQIVLAFSRPQLEKKSPLVVPWKDVAKQNVDLYDELLS